MKLIVGLGNIGSKYENTYHNVGFQLVDQLVSGEKFSEEKKFHGSVLKQGEVIYLKPSTFMNASGVSVRAVAQYFDIPSDQIWVIHDDSDIALGQYKIQFDRGSGGHRGINSMIQELGTKEFHRVRIGIRPQRFAGQKAEQFVLRSIPHKDSEELERVFFEVEQVISQEVE